MDNCIKIKYGPYEAHGIVKHKIQRLRGLINALTTENYELELIPTNRINQVAIFIKECCIFSCDIRNLKFNLAASDDKLCEKIIKIVIEHYDRIHNDTNISKFQAVHEGYRYLEKIRGMNLETLFNSQGSFELIYAVGTKKEVIMTPSLLSNTSRIFDKLGYNIPNVRPLMETKWSNEYKVWYESPRNLEAEILARKTANVVSAGNRISEKLVEDSLFDNVDNTRLELLKEKRLEYFMKDKKKLEKYNDREARLSSNVSQQTKHDIELEKNTYQLFLDEDDKQDQFRTSVRFSAIN